MMNLGSQTGSVINHLYSRMTNGAPEPVVGMGATTLSWTDRQAATVTSVIAVGKSVIVGIKDDHAKVISGSEQDGSAGYEFTARPEGYEHFFKMGKNGWVNVAKNEQTGRWAATGSSKGLILGKRDHYHDPSF